MSASPTKHLPTANALESLVRSQMPHINSPLAFPQITATAAQTHASIKTNTNLNFIDSTPSCHFLLQHVKLAEDRKKQPSKFSSCKSARFWSWRRESKILFELEETFTVRTSHKPNQMATKYHRRNIIVVYRMAANFDNMTGCKALVTIDSTMNNLNPRLLREPPLT